MVMDRLLQLMAEKKASDLFLAPGSPVQLKINGTTIPVNQQRLDAQNVEALIREVVADRHWDIFEAEHELNLGYGVRDVGSFRVNVFRQRGSAACVIRFIPHEIPGLAALHLPAVLGELIMDKRGLMLVVGATGSGKSTTLAAMLDHRNENKTGHILTLEDPIEFTFRNKRSIVNQRQIGTDTHSLETALKNAMRQAPDCILIGEIRDIGTMSAALAYAQSGHLVLATLHANNANHALNRIVSFYTPESRRVLLSDLSATLKAVVSQRLVRALDGGRLPAVEVLLNTRHIAELIEQGRLTEIKDAMEQSLAAGSCTFDRALAELVRERRIAKEDAMAHADSPTNLLWMLENESGDAAARPAPAAAAAVSPAMASAALGRPQPSGTQPSASPSAASAEAAEGPSFSEFLLNI
ncbi:MAG: PilT/PilU family type 4a pilus ATPase [Burkholderiales bacterium]|nr:PilT/PilU family type 4a pilus ATPase [Burkholderiales bacterium]OJX05995.1 MAG: type IV pili twitching motility protein PilT [Burkholderiales bacterium 70-64]